MALYISQLLGRDQASFGKLITELESMHNAQAVDVQLVGDLINRMTQLHQSFGLDPGDTTSVELYRALRSRIQNDNQHLAEAIGGKHPNAVSEMTPLIVKATKRLFSDQCWVIKPEVAQKILTVHSPTATLQALGYKTIDQALKSLPVEQIMVLARYLENQAWNMKLIDRYQTLKSSDYESRPLQVVYIDRLVLADKLSVSRRRHRLVLHSKEMGIVAIAPTTEKVIRSYTIRTLSLVIHYLLETLALSHLISSAQTNNSGQFLSECLLSNNTGHLKFGDINLHHRGIKAFASNSIDGVENSGLTVNDILASFDERLSVWSGHAVSAKNSPEIVSANIIDLSIDDSSDLPYPKRSLRYMRRDLERELLSRYLQQPSVRRILLMRLGLDYE